MDSNSKNMSIEEVLVQHLKTVGLGLLITDEDALTELTRRAIEQALFQPTRSRSHLTETDSIVITAAKEIGKQATSKIVEILVAEVLEREDVKKAMREAIAAAIPDAIRDFANGTVHKFVESSAYSTAQTVASLIKGSGG